MTEIKGEDIRALLLFICFVIGAGAGYCYGYCKGWEKRRKLTMFRHRK